MRVVGFLFGLQLCLLPLQHAQAEIPPTYTNENFHDSEHDKPATFYRASDGNFYGVTETGKFFSQIVIENDFGIKLHKFSIDEAHFYITDRGIIYAENDILALSIYLTRTA